MKHPDQKSESILITHIVNPHQFYYKYTNRIVNGEFSKFDFEIQLYGNELYARKTLENGYVPVENELVIFFDVIFNKWTRGRAVTVGQDITFWCIDNGIWVKLVDARVLPLTKRFQEDMKVVHLGGLSLLPSEKTLNVESVEVETRLAREWDEKSINLFKRIISTSKTILFTQQFELENHKFGSVNVESKTGNKKEINQILLEMNNAAHTHQYSEKDLWLYVHEARLQAQLSKSMRTVISNPMSSSKTTVQRSFLQYGSEISSIENLAPNDCYFDDSVSRQSWSDNSTILEPTICHRQTEEERYPREVIPSVTEERCQNPKLAIPHPQAEISKSEGYEDLASCETSPPAQISRSESESKFLTEDCHLRVYENHFAKNVRQQPLSSTMNWINSMKNKINTSAATSRSEKSCASSVRSLTDDHHSIQTPSASATSATSRRKILANLVQMSNSDAAAKEPASDTTVKKFGNVPASPLFGIPAGYAKNCLDTFGGLNKS